MNLPQGVFISRPNGYLGVDLEAAYLLQYHSCLQREHRLDASFPHTQHLGTSARRESMTSKLYVSANLVNTL